MKKLLNKLSFSNRMAIGIFALSLILTNCGGIFYYYSIYNIIITQIGSRLKDVGRTGAFLFGPQERQMIESLIVILEKESIKLDQSNLKLDDEEILETITRVKTDRITKTREFQTLVQKLRQIKEGSRPVIQPFGFIPQIPADNSTEPLVKYTYLLVGIPQSPDYSLSKFLVDADFESLDEDKDGKISEEEEGTKPGTIWKTPDEVFIHAFNGEAAAARNYYEDKWGTWLSAAVPIKSSDGRVIAVIGLDYNMTNPTFKD